MQADIWRQKLWSGRRDPGKTSNKSGKKKPRPKLFGPDIFGWGGGLPRGGVGAGMSFETQENQTFGGICRDCRDIPGGARKL